MGDDHQPVRPPDGAGHEGTGRSTGGPAGGSGGLAYDERRPEHRTGRAASAGGAGEDPADGSHAPGARRPGNVRDEVAGD
jgi:hypothetical protein